MKTAIGLIVLLSLAFSIAVFSAGCVNATAPSYTAPEHINIGYGRMNAVEMVDDLHDKGIIKESEYPAIRNRAKSVVEKEKAAQR